MRDPLTSIKAGIVAMPAFAMAAVLLFATMATVLLPAKVQAAACAAPSTNLGSATSTISVPAAAKYRLWSRIMTPNAANNSYLLEVDGNQCFTVGGKSIPTNTWTWVDYQNGNTASKIELQLSQGNHTVKFIGRQAEVKLDRLIATSDLACVPTGSGDNCNAPTDTTPPAVSLTSPAENATVNGEVNIAATASDNTGVRKVDFYVNSELKSSDTSAPYSTAWNTNEVPNGTQSVIAKAYDAAGNVSTDTHRVLVRNADTEAPSTPSRLEVSATAHNKVVLNWNASTDNEGISGYTVMRNNVPLATIGTATNYTDTTVLPNTNYTYQVTAFDIAGNKSAPAKVTAKTPNVPDTKAPTAPTNPKAVAASATQINLSWQAATDNIGISSYEVYRKTGNAAAVKIADVASTSFGDAALQSSTTYSYYVIAKDAAGNKSPASVTVSATTKAPVKLGSIEGRVLSSKSGKATGEAKIHIVVGGKSQYYTSDRRGEYYIRNLAPGTYNVTYGKSTYESQTLSIKVNGNTVKREVTLQLK